MLNTIADIGYQGFVTVELYTYEHAAIDAARNALQYLRKWKESNPAQTTQPKDTRTQRKEKVIFLTAFSMSHVFPRKRLVKANGLVYD